MSTANFKNLRIPSGLHCFQGDVSEGWSCLTPRIQRGQSLAISWNLSLHSPLRPSWPHEGVLLWHAIWGLRGQRWSPVICWQIPSQRLRPIWLQLLLNDKQLPERKPSCEGQQWRPRPAFPLLCPKCTSHNLQQEELYQVSCFVVQSHLFSKR